MFYEMRTVMPCFYLFKQKYAYALMFSFTDCGGMVGGKLYFIGPLNN